LENIVRKSLAAGIVPLSTAEHAKGLVSVPIDSAIRRQVFCVWQHSLSAVAERFMAFSQDEGRVSA